MAYSYQETLKEVDKECYNEKLQVTQLSQYLYKLAEGARGFLEANGFMCVLTISKQVRQPLLLTSLVTAATCKQFRFLI